MMNIVLVILGSLALLYVVIPLVVLGFFYFLIALLNRFYAREFEQWRLESPLSLLSQGAQIPLRFRIFGTRRWSRSERLDRSLMAVGIFASILFAIDFLLPARWHNGYERYQSLCKLASMQDSPQKYSQIFQLKELFYSKQLENLSKEDKEAYYRGQFRFTPHAITQEEFLGYLTPDKTKEPSKNERDYRFEGEESAEGQNIFEKLLFGFSSISYKLYASTDTPNPTSMEQIKDMRFGVKWRYRTMLHTYFNGLLKNEDKGEQTCGDKYLYGKL